MSYKQRSVGHAVKFDFIWTCVFVACGFGCWLCVCLAHEHLHQFIILFWVVKIESCWRVLVFYLHFVGHHVLTEKAHCLPCIWHYEWVLLVLGHHPVQHCLDLLNCWFDIIATTTVYYTPVFLKFYLLLITLYHLYSICVFFCKLSCATGKSRLFWNFDVKTMVGSRRSRFHSLHRWQIRQILLRPSCGEGWFVVAT